MHPGHLTQKANQTLVLFFCYNREQRQILYSSQPLSQFFGFYPSDTAHLPLFQQPQWAGCLELGEGQTREFTFDQAVDGKNISISCKVTAIKMQDAPGNVPVLVCTAEKHINKAADLSVEYDEFIQLAAHDLDAPLRKLTVLIERMLAKVSAAGEGLEYVPRIESSLGDMRAMIDGLSRLAGACTGALVQRPCDLRQIIDNIIDSLRKKTTGKDIIAEIGELPVLEGDPESYRELFSNLLENSVRFSQQQMPAHICINSAEATPEEKQLHGLGNGITFYKISIRDKGIGFNPADAEKIFRPFVRLHGKSEYPGSGIGLAICKKIVENNDGVIYGEGRENEGAGFVLFLPQSQN